MQLSPSQWVEELRKTGKKLLEIIPRVAGSADASVKLRRGASGDQTFYIDEMAEKIVVEAIEKISQNGISFTLISEECGIKRFGTENNIKILLDPIDGSNNAKRGVPYYATSIAILDGERLRDILVGYVVDLSSNKEYWAIRGEGAWCNGERIICRSSDEFDMVAFEASVPAKDIERLMPLLKSSRKVRCLGAIALDLALMGAGAIDVTAIGTPSRSFDYAAGMLILKEAGGIITDIEGGGIGDISAGLERTVPLIASANKVLHQNALKLINGSRQ
ncbi:MAG: hypothetical protein A2035_03790 [Nitrospirae bacterium GWA2_42_11]|nr:MAG: hypothetical protein A2035_03790 [Nitrospirae bacterium GWA2_42_11]